MLSCRSSVEAKQEEAAAPPLPPRTVCLDLPSAGRRNLRLSADKKSIYMVEATLERDESGKLVDDQAVVEVDLATRTRKTRRSLTEMIKTEAGELLQVDVMRNGTVVFNRAKNRGAYVGRLYVVAPSGDQPVALTAEEQRVSTFAIDEASESIVYSMLETESAGLDKLDELHKHVSIVRMSVHGGATQKLGNALRVSGVVDDGVLVSTQKGRFAVWNIADGTPRVTVAVDESESIEVLGNNLAIVDKQSFDFEKGTMHTAGTHHTLLIDGDESADAEASPVLDSAAKRYHANTRRAAQFFSGFHGDSNKIYRLDKRKITPVLTVNGPEVEDVIEIGDGSFAFLACQDVDGSGDCNWRDETDLCLAEHFSEGGVAELPVRRVPQVMTDVAKKLEFILTTVGLAGATTKIIPKGVSYEISLETTNQAPSAMPALRALARDLHARVKEIAGQTMVDVSIVFPHGIRAFVEWSNEQKRFYSYAGIGDALLAEPNEYVLEVYPKILHDIMSFTSTCLGDVKNTTDKPLENLEFQCVGEKNFRDVETLAKGAVSPSTLPKGAKGKFMSKSFSRVYDFHRPRIKILSGNEEIRFFNKYKDEIAQKKMNKFAPLATSAGLTYRRTRSKYDEVTIEVVAEESFVQRTSSDKEKASAKVLKEYKSLGFKEDFTEPKVVIQIFDPKSDTPRWTYAAGRLSEVTTPPESLPMPSIP